MINFWLCFCCRFYFSNSKHYPANEIAADPVDFVSLNSTAFAIAGPMAVAIVTGLDSVVVVAVILFNQETETFLLMARLRYGYNC